MEKELGDRFQPKDYELLTILLRFVIGMGCHRTNIRHEDLYGEKEPWEIFRWDCNEKHQYFFTQLKRKSKTMKGSRINRTVGKSAGTWHGQDKGKPIIDKKTGALLGYKRSFLYQNKMEPEQDRQWLLKEFYLNDEAIVKATETYPKLEDTKDFVLCRLKRKKRAGGEPQEIKAVPVETIVQILLHGAADSTATLPTIEENFDNHYYINPTEEILATTTLPTTEEKFDNHYYINPIDPTEEILAQVQPQPSVLGENNGEQSIQGENNGDDMNLYFDCNILNEDPEMLAMQQRWLEGNNDICIDDLTGPSLEEMLQELAAAPLPQPSMQASEKDASHIDYTTLFYPF
nr:NAC domain-containing protein 78-like [Ipomoea batatas]